MGMRERNNPVAEKLWYVVKDAVNAGVTVDDFICELRSCWVEVYREEAEFAEHQFKKIIRSLHGG